MIMSVLQFSTERDLVASTAELGARAIAADSGRPFVRNGYGWAPESGGLFLSNGRRFAPSTRNTIALTGSSSTDRCTNSTGGGLQDRLNNNGYFFGANLATGQPWRIVKNYGISGGVISTIAPTLDTALSEYPALDFVVLQWFANDIGSVGAAAAEGYIRDALRKCQAQGTKPIVTINWPQIGMSAADLQECVSYRARMLELEKAYPGELFVVDHWSEIAEPGGFPRTEYMADNLHVNQYGAYAVGRAWRSVAQRAFVLPERWRLDQIGEVKTLNWDFSSGLSGWSWSSAAGAQNRIYRDDNGFYARIEPTNDTTNGIVLRTCDFTPVTGKRYVVAADIEVVTPTKLLAVYLRNSDSSRVMSSGRYQHDASLTPRGYFETGERYMVCTDPFDPLTEINISGLVLGAVSGGGIAHVRQLGVVQVG